MLYKVYPGQGELGKLAVARFHLLCQNTIGTVVQTKRGSHRTVLTPIQHQRIHHPNLTLQALNGFLSSTHTNNHFFHIAEMQLRIHQASLKSQEETCRREALSEE